MSGQDLSYEGHLKIAVTDNPELSRYEIHVDDVLAGIEDYRIGDGTITLIHTEVLQQFEGQAMAGHLVGAVLDDARSRGLRVRPRCRYVRSYLASHPEYGDLVDSD